MENKSEYFKVRLRYLRMTLCGRRSIKQLIRRYPERKLVLTDKGIGDQVFMLAYLKEWASYYHIENWSVLAIDTKDSLYRSFSIDENRLIRISARKDEQINFFCTCMYGKRFRARHPEILVANAFGCFLGDYLLENPCIFDFSTLTKAVYRIPQDTKPSECIGSSMENLMCSLRRHGLTNLNRSIVINPYAFSCDQTPFSFFQKITDNLIEKGFSIICSVVGNQKPLNGAIAVDLPLEEMFTLCNTCGKLIGARSGFMDLMAFSDADVICVSNREYEFSDLFQLEKCWPQNPKIQTVNFNVSDEDRLVTKIVNHFCDVSEKNNITRG